MSEVVRVPFHGRFIHTVQVDGEPQVVLRPSVDAMGLNYTRQFRKLRERSWAVVAQTATTGADGKVYDMVTVNLDTWSMLLANINENRVPVDVRPLIVSYQKESARVLREYWTRGRRTEALDEPVTYTWDEATALIRQRYGVVVSVATFRRGLRTAGILRQTGVPKKQHQHFFWFTGSAWEIHPHAIPFLTRTFEDTSRQLQEFRFLQARLELDGVGMHHRPIAS